MTVGKVRKQSGRNTRTNLSHNLDGNKTMPTNNHTNTQQYTAPNIIILQ